MARLPWAVNPPRRPGQAKREPGPITTDGHVQPSWAKIPLNSLPLWLWVPAFAGTTMEG
jgi:hypothetical protein